MKRAWIVCVALAALAVPAASPAAVSQTDFKNAAKFCKALRADMGATTFKQTFGTNKNKSNAYGKCVSKHARTVDEVHSDAVKQCKAERTANPTEFAAKYGSNKNGKNALGKCVSQAERELKAVAADEIENAAKQCKAERKADAAAFASKYGTNKNKRNAFGKCVSKTVRANETENQS
jgi:SOS response regulatory protein OraA/RecX